MATLIFTFVWFLLMTGLLSFNLLVGKPPIQGGCNQSLCRKNCRKDCPRKAPRS